MALGRSSATGATRGTRRATRASNATSPSGDPSQRERRASIAASNRGQVVKAYIVLADGFTPDAALVKALQDHVKAEISPYKYPRLVEFVTDLPRTDTGKLKRVALREIAAAAARPTP